MRSFRLALIAVLGLNAAGCASVQKNEPASDLSAARASGREFAIEAAWVRPTSKKDHLGFRRPHRMAPIVLDSMVIQGNSLDGIVAYSRKNGAQIWRVDVENGVEGGADVAGEKLFFGSSDGNFYCVSLLDGKVLWTFPVRAETLAPPTVENGIVYFQSGADVVYALDAETGKQLWLYNRQITGNLSVRATTRPTISGESVFVGFSDGFIVALKKRDGGLLWERKIGRSPRFQDVDSTPIIDEGNLYVASFDGTLVSLRADTGDVNWSLDKGGYVPVTLGQERWADRLYFATSEGEILVLDKKSGKQLSAIKVAKGIATQPTLAHGFLVYGESEGAMVVADAETGALVGRFDPGFGLMARPIVNEGGTEAYFMSGGANLYHVRMGFRRASDRLPWQSNW